MRPSRAVSLMHCVVYCCGALLLTHEEPAHDIESAIDHAFDGRVVATANRKFIDLQPIYTDLHADDAGNSSTWAFMAVIIIPSLSCESVNGVAALFNDAMLGANPDAGWMYSFSRRFGSSVCADGGCPCVDMSVYSTGVLEVETRCGNSRLALPLDDEFQFAYDARTDMP